MIRATGIPNGIGGVGYGESDVQALTRGAWAQQRLLTNPPREIVPNDLRKLFRGGVSWNGFILMLCKKSRNGIFADGRRFDGSIAIWFAGCFFDRTRWKGECC